MNIGTHLELQPLVYTLAVIKSTVRNIQKYIPEIQDELRKVGYPIDGEIQLTQVVNQVPGSQPKFEMRRIFHLSDPSNTWGVGIGEDGLYFHTTDYHDYQTFSEHFQKVLSIYAEIADISHFQVAAFRQIDNVKMLPKKGEDSWEKVINSKFLPVSLEGTTPSYCSKRIQERFGIDDMELVINSLSFFNAKGPKVPEDLVPLYFALNQDALEDLQENYILADFEAGYRVKGAEEFEMDKVLTRMRDLHDVAGKGFKIMMLPEAIERREKDDA